MNTLTLSQEKYDVLNNFKIKCEMLSKICAMLLGFMLPLSTTATNIVLFLLIVTWFLSGKLEEKIEIIWTNPILKVFLLFFGMFVIGALYSVASIQDRMEILRKMGKLLYLLFLLPIFIEEKWRHRTIWAFISAMLLTFLLSVLKVYGELPIFYSRFSVGAVFKDPIYTNLMMAFASFMVGHYLFQPFRRAIRIALFCLLISFTFYVFFIGVGRSGYVVFTMLWILFCLQRLPGKGKLIGFMGVTLLLALVFTTSKTFQLVLSVGIKNLEQYQAGETHTSLGSRLEYLTETWHLIKERPWFGFGTGSFKESYKAHATLNHLQITQNPHNEYLNILFQLGMFGLLAFLGFLVFLFNKSFDLLVPEKWFAQGILAAMALGCFVNSWLMDFTSGYFFVILIALCFSAFKVKKDLLCE